jgi:hypothetical protein
MHKKTEAAYNDCVEILKKFLVGSWDPSVKKGINTAISLIIDRKHYIRRAEEFPLYQLPVTYNKSRLLKEKIWNKYNG